MGQGFFSQFATGALDAASQIEQDDIKQRDRTDAINREAVAKAKAEDWLEQRRQDRKSQQAKDADIFNSQLRSNNAINQTPDGITNPLPNPIGTNATPAANTGTATEYSPIDNSGDTSMPSGVSATPDTAATTGNIGQSITAPPAQAAPAVPVRDYNTMYANAPQDIKDASDDAVKGHYTEHPEDKFGAAAKGNSVLEKWFNDQPEQKAQRDLSQKDAEVDGLVKRGYTKELAQKKVFGIESSGGGWQGGEEGKAQADQYGVPFHPDKQFLGLAPDKQFSEYEKENAALEKDNSSRQKDITRANSVINDGTQLKDLFGKTATGGFWGLPGVKDVRAAFSSNAALVQKLSNGMALQARPVGFGRVTNFDLQIFQKALPNVGIPNEANKVILEGMIAQANRDLDYHHFEDAWLQAHGHINRAALDKEWDSYTKANPIFDKASKEGQPVVNPTAVSWKDYFSGNKEQAPTGMNTTNTPAPNTNSDNNEDFSHLWTKE